MVYLPSWGVTRRVSRVRHPVPLCSGNDYYSRSAVNALLEMRVNFVDLSDEFLLFIFQNYPTNSARCYFAVGAYSQSLPGANSLKPDTRSAG